MKYILQTLGVILANVPECIVSLLCSVVGWLIYAFPFGRIRVAHSNIYHAFPDMPRQERRKIALESCKRMVEMALFVLASPYLSNKNLRSRVELSENVLAELKKLAENPEPTVLMVPHFAMMETITMFPILVDANAPRAGVFYRPFNNDGLERWVKSSRQRFGVELISRRKGMLHAVRFLRENGCVAVLFDQKILTGFQSLFLDRICTTSTLAGVLVENTKAGVGAFWATRTGFWRSRVECKRFSGKTVEEITFEGNKWLGEKLSSDPIARYDWLWLHRRWQRYGTLPLAMKKGKSILNYSLERLGYSELPRVDRIFITAPDSLRETIALLPFVKAIRKSRPDAMVSLLVRREDGAIIEKFAVADEVIRIPNKNDGVLAKISAYRAFAEKYVDIHLAFADSLLDDFCSYLMQPEWSFAIQSTRKRCFMSGVYVPDGAQSAEHIASSYESFTRVLGLECDVDFSPLQISTEKISSDDKNYVALICGGEGAHAWTVEKWCALIKRLSLSLDDAKFLVFGDESDSRLAFEISKSAKFADIESIAAKGAIEDIMDTLAKCKMAIATDCPTAHIANALGVKTVMICGSTNTVRRGFVFNSPHVEIFPEGCPIQGGGDSKSTSADKVAEIAISFYNNQQ